MDGARAGGPRHACNHHGARPADQGFPYVIPPLHVLTPNGPVTRTPVKLPEPPADRSASCDSDCLTALATQYLHAMARRDYNSLLVTGNLLVTENGHPTRLGDDTWRVLEQPWHPSQRRLDHD